MGVIVELDQSRQDFHVPLAVGIGKITPESFLQRAYETFCYACFCVEILRMKMINVTLLQPALKGAVEKLTPHIRLQFGKLTNFRHHTVKSLDHVRARFAFQVSGKGLFRKHVNDHQNILAIVVVGFEQRKINEVGLHLKVSTGHDRFS